MPYERPKITEHKNCFITESIGAFRTQFCLYAVFTTIEHYQNKENPTAPFYIGVCKLSEVMRLPDAWRNTKFQELRDEHTIMINIMETCSNETELHARRSAMVKQFRPLANITGYSNVNSRAVITCIEGPQAGVTYRNQTEAAQRNGLSQGAISNHLNGVPGYEIVRGCRFIRGAQS